MKEYKGYNVARVSNGLLEIYLPGKGGSIPSCLKGLYPTETVAFQAIDSYLGNKKAGKNDTADSTS